ncbi:MAG: DUF192 domain-containing protein [Steroidobacteraceae bacterium]
MLARIFVSPIAERTTHPRAFTLLLAGILLGASASGAAQRPGDGPPLEDLAKFPRASIEIRSGARKDPFDVWVADTPARQEQGLMFVRDLPASAGMLFLEAEPRVAAMWMKNTYIELDMVFIRVDGRIAAIFARTVPHSLETISAGMAVKGVLELRGGECKRRGIRVGDLVIHPAFGAVSSRRDAAARPTMRRTNED